MFFWIKQIRNKRYIKLKNICFIKSFHRFLESIVENGLIYYIKPQVKSMRLHSTLLACLLLTSGFAYADGGYESGKYRYSVFSGSHKIQPAQRIDYTPTLTALQQQFPGWNAQMDRLDGSIRDAFGPGMHLAGSSLIEKTQNCLNQQLTALGLQASDWTMVRNIDIAHASYVDFEQYLHGHRVAFSRLSFRYTPEGKLVRIRIKDYGQASPDMTPTISAQDVQPLAIGDITYTELTQFEVKPNWEWFPIPHAQGYTLRPAWRFEAIGAEKNLPFELDGYVDAITGNLLYRGNRVHEGVDQVITGVVYTQNPLQPTSIQPLPNLLMSVGGTPIYTDENGLFEDPSATLPLTTQVLLRGKWSEVRASGAGNIVPNFTNIITTNGSSYIFPDTGISSIRHVNAYYHVNVVHDHMKEYMPGFTQLDNPLRTNVDVSGSCNAFFTTSGGGSINFYQASGSCNSFALCGDIVYHEYGHAIAHYFYNSQGAGYMENGALNEGQADVWGFSITGNPIIGVGAFSNPNSYIRRYDLDPKVYPFDIEGEVHADGEIIAGAWWDVFQNIGDMNTMMELFTKTFYDLPDGPNGTEGEVYYDVLISALHNDDDDGDITNGTPNFEAITSAFARHGIYLLSNANFMHTEIDHPQATTPIPVATGINISMPAFLGDVKVFYKERGNGTSWNSVLLTQSGGQYVGEIPGFPEGTIIDYYFAAYDNTPNASPNVFGPSGFMPTTSSALAMTVNIPYQFGVGIATRFTEDFEGTLSNDWSIGLATDNATGGQWVHASPVGSSVNGVAVQPGYDHTTGTSSGKCLVTGNAPSTSSPAGTADVDNGVTTVVSPLFDLSEYENPIVEYYRWYSNDMGANPRNDQWEVQVRNSATSAWRYVDRTNYPDASWRRRIFALKEYYTSINQFMIRFIASDKIQTNQSGNGQSMVEAAVDDLFLYDNSSLVSVAPSPEVSKAKIYPNPTSADVTLEIPNPSVGHIVLYDISGKELQRIETQAGKQVYTLSLKAYPSGIYQVMVQMGKTIQVSKITVTH